MGEVIGSIIVGLLMLLVYLIPSIVAHKRNHKNKLPIILVNVFLGWSMFGWVGALVWALMNAVDVNDVTKTSSVADEIEKLHDLFEKGALSKEEFEQKKETLLK